MACVSALRRSGRFSTSRATGPSRVNVMLAYAMGKVLASAYPRNKMKRLAVSLLVAFLCCAADWSIVSTPAPGPTQSIGFYTAGCLQGAQPLPLDGQGYEAIRISRNRYWGQPVMLDYIQTLAARIKAAGQAHLYIGDIGQPRGGPAPTGHASHQVGLDADIWFERPPVKLPPPDAPQVPYRPKLPAACAAVLKAP